MGDRRLPQAGELVKDLSAMSISPLCQGLAADPEAAAVAGAEDHDVSELRDDRVSSSVALFLVFFFLALSLSLFLSIYLSISHALSLAISHLCLVSLGVAFFTFSLSLYCLSIAH